MKTYNVTIKTSNGDVTYSYESEKNETVNVMWKGEFQCVACNGECVIRPYAATDNREVEGR